MLSPTWRSLLLPFARGTTSPRRRRPDRTRLWLEVLEDRLTPAIHTWTGATSNLWSVASNWTGGSPSGDNNAVLNFPASASNTANQNNLTGLKVIQINFSGTGYSVTGNALTLNSNGTISGTGASNTFAPAIALSGGSPTLSAGSGASLTLSGVISGGGSMTKTGAGTLVFSGANTFSNFFAVNQGILNIRNAKALGTANSTLVADGATLEIQGGITVAGESLSLGSFDSNGTGTAATLRNVSGANTWTGTLFFNSNAVINVTGTLLVSGVVQGTDSVEFEAGENFTKSGAGVLEFSNSNTYTAFTDVAAGTLLIRVGNSLGSTVAGTRVQAGATLALQQGSGGGEVFPVGVGNEALELNGAGVSSAGALRNIAGTNAWAGPITLATTSTVGVAADLLDLRGRVIGAGGLTKVGAGLLSYSGPDANTYAGATQVSGGTLLVNKLLSASATTVASQATLGGNGTTKSITLQGGILSPGSSTAILKVQGNVNMDAASKFDVEINGANPGTNYDQLQVTSGTASLGGATLRVSGNGGAVNGTFVIIQAPAVTSTFAGLANNAEFFLANGVKMRINYTSTQVILTHLDTAPAFQNRQVTTPIDERQRATVTGMITEPDTLDTFFLDVNWGDGTPTQTYVFPPGTSRDVSVSHRYRDDNPTGTPEDIYTINLFWHDEHGLGNSGTLAVTVRNVAPEVFAGGDATIRVDKKFERSGFFRDPGRRDTWTVTVDYGDGTGVQTLEVHDENDFKLKHRYETPGTYHVVVTVIDDDGGVGTTSFDVTVLDKHDHDHDHDHDHHGHSHHD